MKSPSNSNHFYSRSRVLLGLLVVLLIGCVLLASFGAISKTFAARAGSPQAGHGYFLSGSLPKTVSSNLVALRLDRARKSLSGHVIPAAASSETLVQSGRLAVEIGSHLGHRAAMYLMLLLRLLIPTSL